MAGQRRAAQGALAHDQAVGQFLDVRAHLAQFTGHHGDAVRFLDPGLRHIGQSRLSLGEASQRGHHRQRVGRAVHVDFGALQIARPDTDAAGVRFDLGPHRAQILDDRLVALGIAEVQPPDCHIAAFERSGAKEKGGRGEIRRDAAAKRPVALAAGYAEAAHRVVFETHALAAQPVEGDLDIRFFVENRHVEAGVALGERAAKEQAGQILAGHGLDRGRSAAQFSPGDERGAFVAARRKRRRAQIRKRAGQWPARTAANLLVAGQHGIAPARQQRARAQQHTQRRARIADIQHVFRRARLGPKTSDAPHPGRGFDFGAERAEGFQRRARVGAVQRRLDPAFALGQRSDGQGAHGVRLGAGDFDGPAQRRGAAAQNHENAFPGLRQIKRAHNPCGCMANPRLRCGAKPSARRLIRNSNARRTVRFAYSAPCRMRARRQSRQSRIRLPSGAFGKPPRRQIASLSPLHFSFGNRLAILSGKRTMAPFHRNCVRQGGRT
ncbi:MAG: hypothetical protein BWZ10_02750 [candidate division BRC1 bacterium ADurb.BinA364]|nr:MAG: hypothetical protein BWZ10_02750 [candidate division BRC1 bacterium ADurb.BinA364]